MSCARGTSLAFLSCATAATVIYTLSLHDALPILSSNTMMLNLVKTYGIISTMNLRSVVHSLLVPPQYWPELRKFDRIDRKSTRPNSSHLVSSYAVFCLKKKN